MKKIILVLMIANKISLGQYSNKTLKEDFDFMYNSSAFIFGDYYLMKHSDMIKK